MEIGIGTSLRKPLPGDAGNKHGGSTGEAELPAGQARFPLWTEDWMYMGPRPFHLPKPFPTAYECLKSLSVPRLGSCHCHLHKHSTAYTVAWAELSGHVWTFRITWLTCTCRRTKQPFYLIVTSTVCFFSLKIILHSSLSCLWVCIAGLI